MCDLAYPWCPKCGNNFPMRQNEYDDLEECGNTFYCSKGHRLIISRESVVKKCRRQERRADRHVETISRLQKRIESFQGVITRQHNRLLRGLCPYCRKTPNDIARHIQLHHTPKVKWCYVLRHVPTVYIHIVFIWKNWNQWFYLGMTRKCNVMFVITVSSCQTVRLLWRWLDTKELSRVWKVGRRWIRSN